MGDTVRPKRAIGSYRLTPDCEPCARPIVWLTRPTLAQELIDFSERKTLGKEAFQRMAAEELRCEVI
jgi:hypothetical protein